MNILVTLLPIGLLFLVGCYGIPIPPDQLLSWLVPEICPTSSCPKFDIPVCGSDSVTYVNECYLKQANCSGNGNLVVSFFGDCSSGQH